MWSSWFVLGTYGFWFIFKAKMFQPLTLDDLALTWKLHKQQTGCKASHILSLLIKNDEVVGFKCGCGYEFLQKRLITQKVHTYAQTRTASASPLLRTRDSLRNLGLRYSYIREI